MKINKATDDNNLFNAGVDVNLNIPKATWLYLGLAISIPSVIIILMLILKEKI